MLEAVGTSAQLDPAAGPVEHQGDFHVSPGLRYAIDFASGLQVVPGVAVPIGLSASGGDWAVFGYLSFEHPLFVSAASS
jgi:hypothetical protein